MRILIALLLVLSAVACETVPITGRSQLIVIPEGTEVKMGLDSYQQILSKSKVSSDPRIVEQVTRVGRRIAAATERSDYQWEFTVIEGLNSVPGVPKGAFAISLKLHHCATAWKALS